jgi:hypothetical protein
MHQGGFFLRTSRGVAPAFFAILCLLGWTASAEAAPRRPRRVASDEAAAADLYVAPNGRDSWSGTLPSPNATNTDGPFASVARAQAGVKKLVAAGSKHPLTVMLRGGSYYLPLSSTSPGTLTFTASDSGTANAPVTWQNYPQETPIVSGGVAIGAGGFGLTWSSAGGNLWQVPLPAGTEPFEYLYYNQERRLRARVQSSSPTSVGYYMSGGACHNSLTKQVADIAQCNLGAYMRIVNPVAPTDPGGAGCTSVTNSANPTESKCLDRFAYNPADPITTWKNVNPGGSQCGGTSNSYPAGDVEVTIFDAWTVDVMRVSCVDTQNHVIRFTGATLGESNATGYESSGPMVGHRFIVENVKDAFDAAQAAGQTGIWFLDRSKSPWVLNYLASQGENPNTDTVVIAQTSPVMGTNPGGSLLAAVNLQYATFRGIVFEVDNYVPPAAGFNNDASPEWPLPQAIDCESCQYVTFDGITVRHTSASGLLIASTSGNSGQPAANDVVENSAFYDIGDCGIRLGHHYGDSDKSANTPQFITIQNNLIQGYSRVFPDGRGISLGQGHDMVFQNNDINDGYHAGISVCNTPCNGHTANAANITSQYNHIWNIMQGVTADGGTLYYSSGAADGAAVGNKIFNNLLHDNTDSSIIDNGVAASGYGGWGIYLDGQTAGVDVENNVVFRTTQAGANMTNGPAPGQPPNTFNNNIFAYGQKALFTESSAWPQGCTNASMRASLTNNIFYFDRTDSQNFYVVTGCSYSCGLNYNQFQNFQNNLYWRTDGKFATYGKAFHVMTKPPADTTQCGGGASVWTFLTFPQWQGGMPPNGIPAAMSEDATGSVTMNPHFGNTGNPTDFLLSANLLPGFDYTKTNDTILHAGRTVVTLTAPPVPATFPAFTFSQSDY